MYVLSVKVALYIVRGNYFHFYPNEKTTRNKFPNRGDDRWQQIKECIVKYFISTHSI